MPRPAKVCTRHGCPNLQPCPDHTPAPWASSTRRTRTANGWKQQADARAVMARDHGICHACGHPGADQVDHVIGVAEGGADAVDNKAPIHDQPCPTCGTRCHPVKTARAAARTKASR